MGVKLSAPKGHVRENRGHVGVQGGLKGGYERYEGGMRGYTGGVHWGHEGYQGVPWTLPWPPLGYEALPPAVCHAVVGLGYVALHTHPPGPGSQGWRPHQSTSCEFVLASWQHAGSCSSSSNGGLATVPSFCNRSRLQPGKHHRVIKLVGEWCAFIPGHALLRPSPSPPAWLHN